MQKKYHCIQKSNAKRKKSWVTPHASLPGFILKILPQLIETKDFIKFNILTLNGKEVQNKGMALFPRKIDGRYVMLSRQDGENNHIMFSDNILVRNSPRQIPRDLSLLNKHGK